MATTNQVPTVPPSQIPAGQAHATFTALSQATAHFEALAEEPALYLESNGYSHEVPMTDAQKKQYQTLHKQLSGGDPNVTINLKRGHIERDGRIIGYPDGALVDAMRKLYHEVLGQKYSDIFWAEFENHDRAAKNDPPSFSARQESPAMQKIKTLDTDLSTTNEQKRYDIAKDLQKGISTVFRDRMKQVDTRISLHAESHKNSLGNAAKKMDTMDDIVLAFQAKHPSKDLTPQDVVKFLQAQKKDAITFLQKKLDEAFHEKRGSSLHIRGRDEAGEPDFDKKLDEMASELALLSCPDRESYDFGCTLFRVKQKQTPSELFIAQLTNLIANNAKQPELDQYIRDHSFLIMRDLPPAEKFSLQTALSQKVSDVQKTFQDSKIASSTVDMKSYKHRKSLLACTEKQRSISNSLKDIKDTTISSVAKELDKLADESEKTNLFPTKYMEMRLNELTNLKTTLSAPDAAQMEPIIQKQKKLLDLSKKAQKGESVNFDEI